MRAKQYLKRIRSLDKQILANLEQIAAQRTLATRVVSVLQDAPQSHSGHYGDRLAGIVAEIVDLEEQLQKDLEEYISLKSKVITQINSIEDGRLKLILYHRYLNQKTWEDIACDLNCSVQWVHTLHGQALQEFEKILETS
jgi:DNA-directed RNA polymerase specialized sigma subunit